MNACPLLDLAQDYRTVHHLSYSAGAICFVILHAVIVHDRAVFRQELFKLRDMLITDFPCLESIASEIDAVRHLINKTDTILLRALRDRQCDLV